MAEPMIIETKDTLLSNTYTILLEVLFTNSCIDTVICETETTIFITENICQNGKLMSKINVNLCCVGVESHQQVHKKNASKPLPYSTYSKGLTDIYNLYHKKGETGHLIALLAIYYFDFKFAFGILLVNLIYVM